MTGAGQLELVEMIKKRDDPRSRLTCSLNILECASQDVSSMEVDNNDWARIDLTVDSGACDSVMPRKEPCEKMKIYPSVQPERGLLYWVAHAETLPCLGEKRLAVWTDAETPKAIAILVADVHKPQLSLSRCADTGLESRFGKDVGALVDGEIEELTPLHRQVNLFMLQSWI